MLFFIITTILLLGVSTYLGYRVWFLAGVVGDIQEQTDGYVESLEATNRYMYSKIIQSYENMKRVDQRGAFEAEDETGTTFQLLLQTITELKDQFNGEASKEK